MSFFKDFKEDLSQAVNELATGDELQEEEGMEDSPEMMVNTMDELDIESELSKLDGLLEPVSTREEVRRVELKPEDPVMEQVTRPEPRPEKTKIAREPMRREATREASRPRSEKAREPEKATRVEKKPFTDTEPELVPLDRISSQEDLDEKTIGELGSLLDFEEEAKRKAAVTTQPSQKESRPAQKQIKRPEPVRTVESVKVREADAKREPEESKKEIHGASKAQNAVSTNIQNSKSNVIKEDVPMSEEMTKETTINLDDELSSVSPEITDEVSVITEGTTIKGNLSTTGSFSISGNIEGNVQCNGKLEVTGVIRGNSSSSEIFADAAKIEGEIVSTGTVKIGLGSVVVGNITATSAVIAGAVKGDIDVQGPVVVDTSAVIVGNIKSRSVQINNGAVIEGFCSQCYADIDVDTLFGDKKGN